MTSFASQQDLLNLPLIPVPSISLAFYPPLMLKLLPFLPADMKSRQTQWQQTLPDSPSLEEPQVMCSPRQLDFPIYSASGILVVDYSRCCDKGKRLCCHPHFFFQGRKEKGRSVAATKLWERGWVIEPTCFLQLFFARSRKSLWGHSSS